ncbi:RnfABCDGE type electron transport complex subunit D [Patescibacteria group bacterium]|nr:RnfABCDGE type electron transport complex subunit D [Patescibacteria group bacterium]
MLDKFLNDITMYKLVLYYLISLVAIAVILSFTGILSFNPLGLLFSAGFLVLVCYAVNWTFARTFAVTANAESVYISALILALIITPAKTLSDLPFLFWAGVWAMAGKFIFALNGKHLFNPVAISVFLTSVFLGQSASWWIGTGPMLIPVLLGGILLIRKTDRTDMVLGFLLSAFLTIVVLSWNSGPPLSTLLTKTVLATPLLFFAFVMLTEPLTTPPTKNLQLTYGVLVGILFAPQLHIGPVYSTPELALLLGNIFSYSVSFRKRLFLKLKEKLPLGPDVYDFVFTQNKSFTYRPGQFLEWTLAHQNIDSRGNRRYFTLASSPTEPELRIGVKFNQPASSFKKSLLSLTPGAAISAANLAGDFTLPSDPNIKLVFIAGGIGITPFRSMIRYLLDTNQKRDIILLYRAKEEGDFVYKNVFEEAQNRLEMKIYYSVGRFTAERIAELVPDIQVRTFYLSGPRKMIKDFEKTLADLGVRQERIRTDFFPGF